MIIIQWPNLKSLFLTWEELSQGFEGRVQLQKINDCQRPGLKPYCNVMAEGFRFMPLCLVRLRTFRSAHGLVRC